VALNEELLILASCLLRPMSRNSVLEEFSVRRFETVLSAVETNRSQMMLGLANMADGLMIRRHIQSQQTSQQQRCGRHGALSCSGRTPRRSFPRRLLFSASDTLNQDVICISKYVNKVLLKVVVIN